MGEGWLYKLTDLEIIRGMRFGESTERDPFLYWESLDKKFLGVVTWLARLKGLEYSAPFWTKYFSAYLSYAESGHLSRDEIGLETAVAATENLMAGAPLTGTGLRYAELIKP